MPLDRPSHGHPPPLSGAEIRGYPGALKQCAILVDRMRTATPRCRGRNQGRRVPIRGPRRSARAPRGWSGRAPRGMTRSMARFGRPATFRRSAAGGSRPIATASGTSRKENGPAAAARCVPAPGAVSGCRVKFSDRGGPVLSAAGGRIFGGRPNKSPPNAFSRTHALRGDRYGTGRHLVVSERWLGGRPRVFRGRVGAGEPFYPAKSLPGPATFSRGRQCG